MKDFQEAQLTFTDYLRAPLVDKIDNSAENRRKEIYRDLVYKNIERCIAESFPITRNIISDDSWHFMVRDFIAKHNAQTPYFFEICQEFLGYLMTEKEPNKADLPFMLELAHFEWIRLALDIAVLVLPNDIKSAAPTEHSLWSASPLLVALSYRYPVDEIDECNLPAEQPLLPTHLLVFRNSSDDIKVEKIDILTLRLIQLLQEHKNLTSAEIFAYVSAELNEPSIKFSLPLVQKSLCDLANKDAVLYRDVIKN